MRQVTTLDMWLQVATRCLSAESAAQVRREIREHHDSALQAALESGAGAQQADVIAVSSLGNPRTANRQYRRVLLTGAEARMLREARWERQAVCGRSWVVWSLRALPVVLLGIAAITFATGRDASGRMIFLVGVIACFFAAAPTFPLYTPSRARIFRWLKWSAIVVACAFTLRGNVFEWFGAMSICLWGIAWIEWTRHRIRRKIPAAKWPRELYL